MDTSEFTSSNVVVNIVELSDSLAHDAARDELIGAGKINDEEEMHKPVEDEEDVLVYTDEAQDIYNDYYDYFFGKIEECVIKEG